MQKDDLAKTQASSSTINLVQKEGDQTNGNYGVPLKE